MRPVHRNRKFNPKKFTYGQFMASPYAFKRTKSGKRPYRVEPASFSEQTMHAHWRKRRGLQPPKRNVNYITEQKHKHIVNAAHSHKNMDWTRFYRDLLRAQGLGARRLRPLRSLARNPRSIRIGTGGGDQLWNHTGLGHNPYAGFPWYDAYHPVWG